MQTAISIFKIAALAAVATLCITAAILIGDADKSIRAINGGSAPILSRVTRLLDQSDATLGESRKLINDGRYTLVEVNRNVLDERKMYEQAFPDLVGHVNASLQNVDAATADLHPLFLSATARLDQFQSVESGLSQIVDDADRGLGPILYDADQTIKGANTLVANPNVPILLTHFAGISASADSMLFTANRVETKATYNYLNPPHNPVKRTWQAVQPFLLPGAQIGAAIVR
jgi:hypothetical protein